MEKRPETLNFGFSITNTKTMNTTQKTARMTGFLYLMVAICSGFAYAIVHKNLVVAGNAAATADNIIHNRGLFRLGLMLDLTGQVFFTLLPFYLYKILYRIQPDTAAWMAVLAWIGVPIACINLVSQFAAGQLLSGAGYLSAFETDQLQALSLLFLDIHAHGVLIAQIFWGIWLLPLGILVYRSKFLPKFLAILLILSVGVYVIGSFIAFLAPRYAGAFGLMYIVPATAELGMCLWLLIRGVKPLKRMK